MNRGSWTVVRRVAACGAIALLGTGAGSCAASLGSAQRLSAAPAPGDGVTYDHFRQKSVHNAYDQVASLPEQLDQHGFRSVEIDVHRSKIGRGRLEGDWWVYHDAIGSLGDAPSCPTLSSCLAQIEAFHRAKPDHEVLTLFIDLKDDLDETAHGAHDLNARLRASLSPGATFEPAHARARCPAASSVRDAVAGACAWPTLRELRGKTIVVLTGGDLCGEGTRLGGYLDAHHGDGVHAPAAFVAPRVRGACGFEAQARSGEVVFFNLDGDSFHHAEEIRRARLVSRAFGGGLTGGVNDPDAWLRAVEAGVTIVATDRVDAATAPWTNAFAVSPALPSRAVAGR